MSDDAAPGAGVTVAPGWYPDDAGGQRWWDGLEWGERVAVEPVSGRRRVVTLVVGGVAVLGAAAAAVVFSGVLEGGSDGPAPGSPAAVTLAYLDAEYRADFSAICELSTENQATAMRYALSNDMEPAADCAELTDNNYSMHGSGVRLESTAGAVTQDGDEASVEYLQSASYSGPNDDIADVIDQLFGSDGTASGRVTLVREAGSWRVEGSSFDAEVDE